MSLTDSLLTERTSNVEDIPGEIVSGSTLDKLIEFGMREGATSNDTEKTAQAANDADTQPTARNASSSQENLDKATEEEAELFTSLPPMHMPEVEEEKEKEKSKGPRALRRRHGKKMDRSKLRRDAIQYIFPEHMTKLVLLEELNQCAGGAVDEIQSKEVWN